MVSRRLQATDPLAIAVKNFQGRHIGYVKVAASKVLAPQMASRNHGYQEKCI